MLRKEREGEGSRTFTGIKIRDQVLPQIKRNKRRIYLRSKATVVINKVSMPIVVEVLTKGSLKDSTTDVEEDHHHKKQKNEYRT